MGSGSRKRHLTFVWHLWACMPFALAWPYMPEVQAGLNAIESSRLYMTVGVVLLYMVARTVLAFRDPRWLKWDLVFPPIDAAIVSIFIYVVDSHPLSNISILYLLPMAEAAQTLNWKWSTLVAALCIVGSIVATRTVEGPAQLPQMREVPFNVAFRFYFLIVISSLLTLLAKQAAEIRAELRREADRNRLAHEMHDGLQGSLITAANQLELVSRLVGPDPKRAAEVAIEGRDTVRQATDELRFLVQRLRTHELVGGFEPALRQYSHNLCERNGLGLNFLVSGTPARLGADSENALFRIAQEALNNILRHSQASNVEIRLAYGKDRTCLTISDDGVGFDEPAPSLDHAGLEGMKMRANEIQGTLEIARMTPGTRIRVEIPNQPHWIRLRV